VRLNSLAVVLLNTAVIAHYTLLSIAPELSRVRLKSLVIVVTVAVSVAIELEPIHLLEHL